MSDEPEQKDDMTQAQRQAVEKAWDLLSEHFDRVLLVVDYDIQDGDVFAHEHEGYWHGGAMSAIGLAEYCKDRILHGGKSPTSREPEDE